MYELCQFYDNAGAKNKSLIINDIHSGWRHRIVIQKGISLVQKGENDNGCHKQPSGD